MSAQLFFQLVTTNDRALLKSQYEMLKRSVFSTSKSLEQNVSEIFDLYQKDTFLKYLSDKKIDTTNPQRVESAIDGIISNLENLPVISLTTAFHPKNTLLLELLSEIEKKTGKKCLFSILVSNEILGGGVFEYEGRAFDYTVEERINQSKTL